MTAVPHFDVYDLRGGSIFLALPAVAVADFLNIDTAELGWCIEEFGRCDVESLCAVPTGAEIPMPLPEGYEHGAS